MRAQAVVHAAAESEQGRQPVTGDVEAVGVVIDGRVTVGRRRVGEHEDAGGNGDRRKLDVFGGLADRTENTWVIAHELMNGVGGQFGMLAEQRPLAGVFALHLYRCDQLAAGCVRTEPVPLAPSGCGWCMCPRPAMWRPT